MSEHAATERSTAEPEVGREAAAAWIDRWDVQQQEFMPEREQRFTALIDAVAEAAGRSDPLVLDLGCGPGSLSVRLLNRLPGAIGSDSEPSITARLPGSSPCTSTRCGRRASPRSGRCGSSAITGCSALC